MLFSCLEGDDHFKKIYQQQQAHRKKIEKRAQKLAQEAEKKKKEQEALEKQYQQQQQFKALAQTNLQSNPPIFHPAVVPTPQVEPNPTLPVEPNTPPQVEAQPTLNSDQVNLNNQQPEDEKPVIQKLDAYKAKVGNVMLDRQKRRIEIPAKINMTKGILEYIAVGKQGKLHEAVLELMAVPSHIHLALILCGFIESEYSEPDPKTYRRTLKKTGSLLEIYVEWTPENYPKQRLPIEAWLFDRKSKKSAPQHLYMFKGSSFWQGRYVADMEKSVIALIEDMSAVLIPISNQGNPYRGGDLGFEVYTDAIPPAGTSVTLVLEGISEALEKEKQEAFFKNVQEQMAKEQVREIALVPDAGIEVIQELPKNTDQFIQ